MPQAKNMGLLPSSGICNGALLLWCGRTREDAGSLRVGRSECGWFGRPRRDVMRRRAGILMAGRCGVGAAEDAMMEFTSIFWKMIVGEGKFRCLLMGSCSVEAGLNTTRDSSETKATCVSGVSRESPTEPTRAFKLAV